MSRRALPIGAEADEGVRFVEPDGYVLPATVLRLLVKLLVQQVDEPGMRVGHRSERPAS